MPRLTNIASRGADFAMLANAINALRDALAGEIQLTTAGTISVGTGLHTEQVQGTYLDEVDFVLSTGPVGSAAVFDVMASVDGTNFHSTTGGQGVAIAAGQTTASLTAFVNPFLEAPPTGSGPTIRIDVLQVGSGTAGAGLTVTIYTGPF